MKKVLFGLLVFAMCFGALWADEEEDSMFSPSVSIENELTLEGVKSGEKGSKGNVVPEKVENSTTAKFGVGIAIAENFKLKPYVSDTVVANDEDIGQKGILGFKRNDFVVGLGGKFMPMEMLGISFDLGYIAQTKAHIIDKVGGTMQGNGVKFGVGVDVNVESIFLEMGLGYKFKGIFAGIKAGEDDNDLNKIQSMTNTFELEAKLDFFNFIKEGLNSGLVLSNETKIKSNSTTNVKAYQANNKAYVASTKIENEFGIGLHFAPVDFMDFTFLTKVASESAKVYDAESGKYRNVYGDHEVEEPEPKPFSATSVGLGIGLELTKDMFTFGIEYSPTLSVSESYQKDKDATVITKPKKDLGHEFKLVLGIAL